MFMVLRYNNDLTTLPVRGAIRYNSDLTTLQAPHCHVAHSAVEHSVQHVCVNGVINGVTRNWEGKAS